MKELLYLRPLTIADAQVSCLWRTDPLLWKYTEFKANSSTTVEMETEWLHGKLLKENDARFAICLTRDDEYIGNVQLIDIQSNSAELYIFIGNRNYWGKGIGNHSTKLILQYGFFQLLLEKIFLYVNKENKAALSIFGKFGFSVVSETDDRFEMSIDQQSFRG